MLHLFSLFFFFFNDTATTEIYTLSLHDALPTWPRSSRARTSWSPRTRCCAWTSVPTGGGMVRPDPGRGPVHEEPPVEDLPVRAAAAGPVQSRHHRHADGEQPDGTVVAAVDHGAGTVPEPGTFPRLLRPADRTAGRRRAARPAAAADQAAGQAPHQGAGGRRPAGKAGAGPGGGTAPAAPQALPDVPAA